jgi:hypothetical protein
VGDRDGGGVSGEKRFQMNGLTYRLSNHQIHEGRTVNLYVSDPYFTHRHHLTPDQAIRLARALEAAAKRGAS